MSTLPSSVRLVALLNDHLCEIMERERANHTSMHLYCTGPYWVAFERSAYQLRRAFPGQRDHADAPVRVSVSGRDGVRNGSLAAFVRPQAYLADRRAGL